jgi:hypothetical protein
VANPTILNYQIQDDQGVKSRTFLYLAYNGATLNVDGLTGAWEAYGGKIDACIDGQIVGGHVQIPLEPNVAWKAAPAAGNNVNQLMGIQFTNDFNQYLTTFYLPSYKEALLDANLKPDPADPALIALVTDFLSGTPTGGPFTNFANSRDLHDLDADIAYFLTTRKARNNRLITRVIP